MTTDAVTYDVMTPLAARAIFEAVHWTPSIWWRIDRIQVLHPIRTKWVRVGDGAHIAGGSGRSLHLTDVGYVIDAHFETVDPDGNGGSAAEHAQIFRRRAKARRFFRPPYLGRRGLMADVEWLDVDDAPSSHYAGSGTIDLGWTVFDRHHANPQPHRFYRAVMIDGVIDLSTIDWQTLPF